jgi:hypothetical protein
VIKRKGFKYESIFLAMEVERCVAALAAINEILMKECGGKKPKVIFIGEDSFVITNPEVNVPENVPYEEKVRIIAESRWAKNLAEGMCRKLFGVEPGTPEFQKCVERVSRKVAEGVLR